MVLASRRMCTVPSLRLSVALLLLSATATFAADDDEKDNTDFLLNVFSDIGPILALFGEQFARQFLSETFTWEDHVIFACIPLGIMTAISGAIRVQGNGLFRAVIGRARENHAAAEIEYMSSTSTEVCELYNGEGIVRTMGKPYIGQIIVCPDQLPTGKPNPDKPPNGTETNLGQRSNGTVADLNQVSNGTKTEKETAEEREKISCGIHTLETAKTDDIMVYQEYQVESRPTLFKCLLPSSKPKDANQDPSTQGTRTLREMEAGTVQTRNLVNSEGHHPRQETSTERGVPLEQLPRTSSRRVLRKDTLQNGLNSSNRKDSSLTLTPTGHNTEKKNPWLTLRSPNLQLNIPCEDVSERKHRSHLVLAAMVALILQVSLLVIAVSTAHFVSGFEPEPWGLPCYLGGSVLLFLGMLACSVAIEKRTRELTWFVPVPNSDPQRRKNFHLLWVQRNQRVSEQDFGSYIINGGTRSHVMTSSRYKDLEGLKKNDSSLAHEPSNSLTDATETPSNQPKGTNEPQELSFLPLLPLIAVLFGGVGFTVQFIGLRGLPWPCAVSQLGAMILMTIIRALIRRRLTNSLIHYPVLQKHELDYLAIQLVETKGDVFKDHPANYKTSKKRWASRAAIQSIPRKMSGDENDHEYQPSAEILVWKVDTKSIVTFKSKTGSSSKPTGKPVFMESPNFATTYSKLVSNPLDEAGSGTVRNPTDAPGSDLITNPTHGPGFDRVPNPAEISGSNPVPNPTDYPDPDPKTFQTYKGQSAVLVRKRLGDLCKWPDSISKPALALTLSIERFMTEFFPDGLLTDSPKQLACKIPFSRSPSSNTNKSPRSSNQNTSSGSSHQTPVSWINLDIAQKPEGKVWSVDSGQVQAILSLWMAHWTARRVDHLEAESQHREKQDSTDWRRAGDGSHVEYCRRVGENRHGVLKRDISWWVNNAVEGLQTEHPETPEVPHDYTSSGSKENRFSFGFNCLDTPGNLNTSDSTDSTEKPEFLVQHSTADLATVMSQHLFTCFMWNIGCLLPKNLLNRADINISEFVKVESSRLIDLPSSIRAQSGRQLSHRQLTKFVNYAEKQGLGTPDDILLCIIPTFSFFDCLPNNVVLAYDQLLPKPFGNFNTKEQREMVSHHMNLLDCIRNKTGVGKGEYLSLAIVVNTMEFVYLTALHVTKSKACGSSKTTHPYEFTRLLTILLEDFEDSLLMLYPFYGLQRRLETFKNLFNDLNIDAKIADIYFSTWEEQDDNKTFMHKIGFTYSHRTVAMLISKDSLDLREFLLMPKHTMERDIFGWTPLHYAAARPDLEFGPKRGTSVMRTWDSPLEDTLNDNLRTYRWADKFRRSPVHIAAAAGNANLLEILLPYLYGEARLAICKGGIDEMSPLHLAAQGNHRNCNVHVDSQDPQQCSAGENCKRCIVALLNNRLQVQNDTDAWKQSPIQTALTQQCYTCTFSLLESNNLNFSPETPDEFKKPLLSYLNENDKNHRSVGEQLLFKHFNKFETQKGGVDTILHHAIKFLEYGSDLRRLLDMVENSISPSQLPLKVDIANKQGQTPLHLAVLADKPKLVQRLVTAGASPSWQDKTGISPMIIACQQGHLYSANIFLRSDSYRGEEFDTNGKTALHHAISSSKWHYDSSRLEIVQMLAYVMKSIDIRDREDKTPLQCAVEANRISVCLVLLHRKASIKLVDISQLNALKNIVESTQDLNSQSNLETEKQLRSEWECQIRKETENRVNDPDKDGNTALHRAAQQGDDDTLDWLMQNGADFYAINNSGGTAFIEACRKNRCHRFIQRVVDTLNSEGPEPTASRIPSEGIDIDIQRLDLSNTNMWSIDLSGFSINQGDSIYDQSALAWACEVGHQRVVEILLTANTIDIGQKATRYHCYTPLHFAFRGDKVRIVDLLLNRLEERDLSSYKDENGVTPIQFAINIPNQGCLHQLLMHQKAGPVVFSSDELMTVLKICSGFNIQLNDVSRALWDQKAAEGFVDADNWTLADVAGKYGHPDLQRHLAQNIDNSTKTSYPLGPSVFLSDYPDLYFTDSASPGANRTIKMNVTFSKTSRENFCFRTKEPISPEASDFYFEVKIIYLPKNRVFMMGYCKEEISKDRSPGWEPGSWAYHTDDGGLYEGSGWPVIRDSEHICETGDVIRCGVNFETGKGYVTRNGDRLDSDDAFRDDWLKIGKLYPCVGFRDDGDKDQLRVEIFLPDSRKLSSNNGLSQSDRTRAELQITKE